MIQQVKALAELDPFRGSAFACRIRATAEAYGLDYPFARFWVQGEHAALCLLDDVLVLDVQPGAEPEELASFVRMAGARTVLCAEEAARELLFSVSVAGEIMALESIDAPEAACEWNPSLREVHALLHDCESASFVPPEFEPFYLDLSHRIRHETAQTVGLRQNGRLASCAVCSACTEEAAVLSAVAVHPDFRRQGLGALAVRSLAASLHRQKTYIFRADGENEAFYRALGFAGCGRFAELHP
ncbi:GNAT family N-acetyltransferase [Clostridium sp. D33t1_170424_F3]|uniref:GNAT family N-acetyltransferase n=1 Tax=Clostridium sp. D33t1_170424_F3 TaxID=2787099 RepID=UPI0018AA0FD9|nr:GNAT family N-acetyltransferase [Clostridium sp. D33t1_170424_F3]MDC0700639.1 GNAT family N-acetyltransferase [Blautia wexlerae]